MTNPPQPYAILPIELDNGELSSELRASRELQRVFYEYARELERLKLTGSFEVVLTLREAKP